MSRIGGDRFVRVAVDAQVDRPERTFTYLRPAAVDAEAGSLLLVPYGAAWPRLPSCPGEPSRFL